MEDIKRFDISGVNLPPGEDDIRKFEELNNLRIHCVCAQTDGKHVEIYKSAYNPHFILMLMKNPKGESHWCVIPSTKSLSRLISSNISKSKRARHICTNCHQYTFTTEGALKKHEKYCLDHEAQTTKLPTKRDYVMFKNERKKIRPPVSIYADFECYQPKKEVKKGMSSEIVTEHIPSGFCIYVKSRYENSFPSKYVSYTAQNENDDVAREFIQELIKIRNEYASVPACEINMTPNDIIKHEQETKCYLCNEEFTKEDYKVRDHDHHDGHY